MDLKLKGISWAGNIYQKFESMCQEVDEIVRQDRVNYVNNHVENVGESVKKLYSDAVQNLLSPVKQERQVLSAESNAETENNISDSCIEENGRNIDLDQLNVECNDDDDITKEQLINSSSVIGLQDLTCVPSLDSIRQEELMSKSHENINEEIRRSYDSNDAEAYGSSKLDTILYTEPAHILSCENKVKDIEIASSTSLLPIESRDVESSRNNDSCDQTWGPTQLDSYIASSEIGMLNDSSDDLADPPMETIDLHDERKLEESCVIVNSDDLHAFSRRAGRPRSYKKLIQDALSSKRRITKEYEQLAIFYGDLDFGDTKVRKHSSSQFLTASSDLKIIGQDSRDSEWEIL